MKGYSRTVQWAVWGFLGLVILSILALFLGKRGQSAPPLPVFSQVNEFTLTNQFGRAVSASNLEGHPWIANVIFTRCAGPCAQLTRQMKAIQEQLPEGAGVRLVSLTADPQFDTPEVLQEYASRFDAQPGNWDFLTGRKNDIYDLAIKDLKITVVENDPEQRQPGEDLFIHSTRFVMMDERGRVRAYIDGAELGAPEAVLNSLRILLQEN